VSTVAPLQRVQNAAARLIKGLRPQFAIWPLIAI